MAYNRWPQPHYKPLGLDSFRTDYPAYEQGKVYRLRLVGSSEDESTWPEFIIVGTPRYQVINYPDQADHSAALVEVFVVLMTEYEQYVEPFKDWELN